MSDSSKARSMPKQKYPPGTVIVDKASGGKTEMGLPLPKLGPTKFPAQRIEPGRTMSESERLQRIENSRRARHAVDHSEIARANRELNTAHEDPERPGYLTNGLPILTDEQRNPALRLARTARRGGRVIKQRIRGVKSAGGGDVFSTIRVHDDESNTVLMPYDLAASRAGEYARLNDEDDES
jgi:hypothetical protein